MTLSPAYLFADLYLSLHYLRVCFLDPDYIVPLFRFSHTLPFFLLLATQKEREAQPRHIYFLLSLAALMEILEEKFEINCLNEIVWLSGDFHCLCS